MKCKNCLANDNISRELKFCLRCIRERFNEIMDEVLSIHAKTREVFNLPPQPPNDENGIKCNICINGCKIGEGKIGYCGTKTVKDGRLQHLYGDPEVGLLDYYFDPLPTNCVAEWVCPGKNMYGYKNLAVFYRACSFNCLFCQNWHFKERSLRKVSSSELVDVVDRRTFCICYFGGDPTPQILHALAVSKQLAKKNIRICWETNGSLNRDLLKEVAELSFVSGGCVKFDIKAYNETLNIALCGVSNKYTLENFAFLAENYSKKERDYPFLIASTLVIPGYIDEIEINAISKFIANLNPYIPYSLLVFYPNFYMYDLPIPTRKVVYRYKEIAVSNGLKNVNIGNIHLLS